MTDRDTFAAAALTGLLAGPAAGPAQTFDEFAAEAFRLADAMLRERGNHPAKPDSSTNHDAAPAARATADRYVRRAAADGDSARTDKADSRHSEGTGDISEAQIDAIRRVVENGRFIDMSDYGHLRSLLVRLRPEWEGSDDAAESATTPPRNGALSGCETVPDPDSRVWDTPCTPQTQATPTQGSVQGEGSVRDSRNANEPVACGVEKQVYPPMFSLHTDWNWACRTAMEENGTIVPLYRQPQPTLTDAEREAIAGAIDVLEQEDQWHAAGEARIKKLRELLERLG